MTILFQLIFFFNNHTILTILISFLIFLPICIFILDGFKFSVNNWIYKWQKLNFILLYLIMIFIIIIILISYIGEISASDGKDPHKVLYDQAKEGFKLLGDKLGDGASAAAGVSAMAKLIPKNAPIAAKAASLVLGGVSGVLGKRGGQAASKVLFDNSKGSGSKGDNILNSIDKNINTDSSNAVNQNTMDLKLDWSIDFTYLTNQGESINKFLMLSPNENNNSLLSLIFSDNPVEVIVSCILGLNIINLILIILLIISLSLFYFSNLEFELKWITNFLSDSSREKIIRRINNFYKFYFKSIKLNIFIIILVLLFSTIISTSLLFSYVENLETFSNYYINYINK